MRGSTVHKCLPSGGLEGWTFGEEKGEGGGGEELEGQRMRAGDDQSRVDPGENYRVTSS